MLEKQGLIEGCSKIADNRPIFILNVCVLRIYSGIVISPLMLLSIVSWLESHMLSCPFKDITGYDCPGCGMQRSFVSLLNGDFVEAVIVFPAIFPLLFMFLFLPVHLKFNFKFGAQILKWTYTLVTSIMVGNCLLKFI